MMNQSDGPKVLETLKDEIERVYQQIKKTPFTEWQSMNHAYEMSKIIQQTAQCIFIYMEGQCEIYDEQADPSYSDPPKNEKPCNYGCPTCNCKRY